MDPDQIALRIRITLRRQLAEAVFARAVLLVEGVTDRGFLHGLADRSTGFDAAGIAVVSGMGKDQLMLPWAILDELGVPTYVVFDGDSGLGERMRAQSKQESDIETAVENAQRANMAILRHLGATPEREPDSTATDSFTVFHDCLETEAEAWPEFASTLHGFRAAPGEWRSKSEDAYRRAATEAGGQPPDIFVDLLEAVLRL